MLLTGKFPYHDSKMDVLQIMQNISKLNITVPDSVDKDAKELVLGLLQVPPEKRISWEKFWSSKYVLKFCTVNGN